MCRRVAPKRRREDVVCGVVDGRQIGFLERDGSIIKDVERTGGRLRGRRPVGLRVDLVFLEDGTDLGRKHDLGVDAIALDDGVVGPRGFVSLGDRRFFCDEDCLRRHASDEDVPQLPRRIP